MTTPASTAAESKTTTPAKGGARPRLKLTHEQQGALWPMLAEAWLAHALASGLRVNDSKAKEAWRREWLGTGVGVWSLRQVPRGGPVFARVMGRLQEMARNGIDWIVKAGDVTPSDLRHHARSVLAAHDIPEAYACGVARQALKLAAQPVLEDLEPAQLAMVIRILHAQAPRISVAAAKQSHEATDEEAPF